jgi:glutathione S-transferase
MKPILYVGNRNYSSWSMRPWLSLKWAGIDFETRDVQLGGPGYGKQQMPSVLAISPTGTVPALHLGEDVITDSLAISEWAAEQSPALWPRDPLARTYARSAACEMHAGFAALRANLPCNIRRRTETRQLSAEVRQEVDRIDALWASLRTRFGSEGPYLCGANPTIADAFFTPVATRFRTYAVRISAEAQRYVDTLLENDAFQEWERAGIAETATMPQWDAV